MTKFLVKTMRERQYYVMSEYEGKAWIVAEDMVPRYDKVVSVEPIEIIS